MSTIVSDIRTALETQVATILGATWKPMVSKFNIEKSNKANDKLRYGVVVGNADFAVGVLGMNTFDRTYQVILQDRYEIKSDSTRQATIDNLHDQASEIMKTVTANRLGLLSTVLMITPSPVDEPDLEIENLAIIRIEFIIKYREALA